MSDTPKEANLYKPRGWYNKHGFPLIPVLETRPADEWNTSRFTFSWLFFSCWSLDAPNFEIGLVCSTHWGIGFIGILPYLRWTFTIPIGGKWIMKLEDKLWRRPKGHYLNKK
jgi:hypothetical protein